MDETVIRNFQRICSGDGNNSTVVSACKFYSFLYPFTLEERTSSVMNYYNLYSLPNLRKGVVDAFLSLLTSGNNKCVTITTLSQKLITFFHIALRNCYHSFINDG